MLHQGALGVAKRVFRYLKGTVHHGLVYRFIIGKKLAIETFADADYGNCLDARPSVSGYALMMNGNHLRAQTIAVDDTCSAESIAASECLTEVKWAHNLLEQLGIEHKQTVLHQDNQAAIALLQNNGKRFKIRAVDPKYHHVMDIVEAKEIDVRFCSTDEMVTYVLMKPLTHDKFERTRKRLNVEDTSGATAKHQRVK
ncbi:hypothetical protein PybrP1_006711 [[Pythium] brassicae (nom. inval.)]|nr:hypothetical protein PybrP1_006711 [[Pythium] brassicae (nom. inval.)]